MKVARDDGTIIDATFLVEESPLSVVIESAGGRIGVNARNRDYSEGLTTILRRLAGIGAVLPEIRVESLRSRGMPLEEQRIRLSRHSFPLALGSVGDLEDLKRDISRAAREPGARADARRGGSSRRLRMLLESAQVEAAALESQLGGTGAVLEPETTAAAVELAAGRPRPGSGQGFAVSVEHRLAVERRAMEAAVAWYHEQGWTCEDVSAYESYDLRCRRGDTLLHVEVKGTTTAGSSVIVTRREVEEARRLAPHTELFVLSDVRLHTPASGAPFGSGGRARVLPSWERDPARLIPLGFQLYLP